MTLTICENNRQTTNIVDDRGEKLKEQFASPPASNRGKPFWAWNGKLEKDELIRQIDIMHKMGMGGFFMHSRTGLQTPYLSDEWFDCIRVCCEKAKQLGMEAWVYDEDRWPSGFAGGKVTDNDKYRQKRLQLRLFSKEQFDWSEDYLAVFTAEIVEEQACNVHRVINQAEIDNDSNPHIVAFSVVSSPVSEVYNGCSYVDTLSKEAISKFIETTHQAYKKYVGEYFGSVIKGVFTDEPNQGACCVYTDNDGKVVESPWTPEFPYIFKERYGYDIVDNLMGVFFDVDGKHISKPRADYHDCRTFLFVNSFAKQIWQWCNRNNVLFTGHILNESPMIEQASFVGSAMRFYEYMDVPGVDILTDSHVTTGGRPEYDTVKQCVSVQRQMGREQVLSELYGCTGWDFSFEGHKSCGDWQAALGVNLRCHHHMWYSMQGQAKRDYPASISYQSPWWQYYSSVEDYFSRINVLMDNGKSISKLLVIHPNETIWQMIKPGWCTKNSDALLHEWQRTEQINKLEEKYLFLRDCLVGANIDFDYGDEEMLSRLGEVDLADGKLNFGCCRYETVVVPPLKTIRNTTVKLLERFIEHGGRVVVVEQMADYVDAVKDDYARRLQQKCLTVSLDKTQILKAVETVKMVEVLEENGEVADNILCRCSEDNHGRYIFICNTAKNGNTRRLTLKIYNTGDFACVQRWNPINGEICSLDTKPAVEFTTVDISLAPCGSDLIAFFDRDINTQSAQKLPEIKQVIDLTKPNSISLSEPNVLVLDKAMFALNDIWQAELDILAIDNIVRESIGLKQRNGKMIQPWLKSSKIENCEIKLMFGFNAAYTAAEDIFLAVEKPRSIKQIKINGKLIEKSVAGWWIDKSLKKISLPVGVFEEGSNQIELTIDYAECMGLEAVYLLGAFGVRLDGDKPVMIRPNISLDMGDWCKQGLPFYSGSVRYGFDTQIAQQGGKVFIDLESIAGSCAVVYINGIKAGVLWCKPFNLDITDFVVQGNNKVEIEVVSHRRNTLGPFHLNGGGQRPGWTGPAEFSPSEDYRCNDYSVVPCGLFKASLALR